MAEIARIELDASRIRESGGLRFTIDAVEHDGARFCWWSGDRYDAALRQAEKLSRQFGLAPVVDIVAEGFEP